MCEATEGLSNQRQWMETDQLKVTVNLMKEIIFIII